MTNVLLASLSLFYYIGSPVIDMREHPTQESEIVSQAYFSEEIHLIEENQNWVKIETVIDHYQGWIQKDALCQRKNSFPSNSSTPIAKVNRCAAHLYGVQDTTYGPILTLPFDSRLEVLESNSRWIKVLLANGREGYIQRGDVTFDTMLLNRDQICTLSLQFLDLPYTWGGRSSFGYDCSGFVQMLYRQMGIYLPRDSKDQMNWEGFTHISIDSLLPGDLIFFGLAKDKIRHVGMYLGNNQFIHSTIAENQPYIHISNLDDPEWNGSSKFTYRAARQLHAKKFEGSISVITDQIFEQMPYSWNDQNPVPIDDLRCVWVNHWGFDKQIHHGCLIVHKKVAEETLEIFKELFDGQFPIEKIMFVDIYKGSDALSAEDNNSYAFCSRPITNVTGVFSKHSYGLAIDINPLYNPYFRDELLIPKTGTAYLDRENKVKGMISPDTICYQAFVKRGWKWGGDWKESRGYVDYHHFEKDPHEVLR